jgi:hypothetical protein
LWSAFAALDKSPIHLSRVNWVSGHVSKGSMVAIGAMSLPYIIVRILPAQFSTPRRVA